MGTCKDCAFWQEFDGRCLKIGADMTLNDAPEIICNVSSKYEAKPEVKVHAFLSTPPDFGCTLFQRRKTGKRCFSCGGRGYNDIPHNWDNAMDEKCKKCDGTGKV